MDIDINDLFDEFEEDADNDLCPVCEKEGCQTWGRSDFIHLSHKEMLEELAAQDAENFLDTLLDDNFNPFAPQVSENEFFRQLNEAWEEDTEF